ncbi:hypothetical protein JCM3766R1_003342 [Sporobolomyces carnicolor]
MSEPQSSRRSSSTTTKPPIKKANQPFLVHQKYKQQLARDAAAAPRPASSPPGPRGRDGFLAKAARWTVLALLTSAFLSRAVTETWMWNYDPHTSISLLRRSLFPTAPLLTLTEAQLGRYDGTSLTEPIYLAIDGDVYDVSAGRDSYGPGGAYHAFAGKDAARAFVTGCFKTHLTHDLRGFTAKELATLKHWKQFYETHAKYRKVGRVMHPPIDPSLPIPEPCTRAQAQPDPGQVTSN